ncbi:glutathione synthase [Nitrococcus mobilis]|uniref:Glutathione synthetase n=1 Tax=Nitrococcus mobilis Nb-231 TaxID=314278 RepID=A4BSB6_9GAMM|nr:glutathione synthase [Nitrococcus mobilis]EAR21376.1 glutathione synthetase [Nitrococcus mobilis Nb-231]
MIKLGVVMDPIGSITPYKDTTLAMLLEAERRGWAIRYLELGDLSLRDGQAWGNSSELHVQDDRHRWYELGKRQRHPLAELEVILMRKDPPVSNEYLYATYILEAAERAGTLVVNRPQGLRDAQEKLFATHFPQCCAPTLVSAAADELRGFIHEQGKAVLKPLHGMGGESVFVLEQGDPNTSVIIETLSDHGRRQLMAQRYIEEIRSGDKRILLVAGEPVPYVLARIPAHGETRGNIAAGGRGEGIELSDRDRWICEQVAPALRERGLLFVGLDVIGDYLTEINVTSPTCVRELDAHYGINISGKLFDLIEQYLQNDRANM